MIVTAKNADITNFEIVFLESLGFFFLRIKYTGNMNNVRRIVPPIILIENNSTNTIKYLYLTLGNRDFIDYANCIDWFANSFIVSRDNSV